MIIQHNLPASNIMRQLGITNTNLAKSTERLNSGYKINRAADNASGLQVSEKKRAQIRGLLRAVKNADEGISFVQTGDGAMGEIAGLMQRMRELCVQASNDTYTDADRAMIQMEFDQLQSEIDRINDQTEYNTLNVFEHYADNFYTFEGNRIWSQDQLHIITDANNSLEVSYQLSSTDPDGNEVLTDETITLQIPNGTYTTQELMDEMDSFIAAQPNNADGLYLEYTRQGTCNLALQNEGSISDIAGGLSYLFYDEFVGSQVGSLIGTTIFDPRFPLTINEKNNELSFTIENYDGTKKKVDIIIDSGAYTREDMIRYLNNKLAGTGMTASEYGDYSIQLGGEDGIITGLKGNMFQIDDTGDVMVSVFYDNTKYGSVKLTEAIFQGGAVLVNNSSDTKYQSFHIDDQNDKLYMKTNDPTATTYQEITLDHGDYSMSQMITQLQNKFHSAGMNVTVSSYTNSIRTTNGNSLSFSGIIITSKEQGPDSTIEFDTTSSTAYNTLFTDRMYTDIGQKTSTANGTYSHNLPYLIGGKSFTADTLPLTIDSSNNKFQLKISELINNNGTTTSTNDTYTITLAEKEYHSLDEILAELNEQFNGNNTPTGLKNKVQAVAYGNAIQLIAPADNMTMKSVTLTNTGSDLYKGGYNALFVGKTTEYSTKPVSSSSTTPKITLDPIDPSDFASSSGTMDVIVGGETKTVTIPSGNYDEASLLDKINEQLKGYTKTVPKTYSGSGTGSTTDKNKTFSSTGQNRTLGTINCNVTGSGGSQDGSTAIVNPKPASYTVPVALKNTTAITADNDSFTITINGHNYSVQLDHKNYTPQELSQALNDTLNNQISTSADKVNVTLTADNKLSFTTAAMGKSISMAFDDSSSLMNSINHEKTGATINTGIALQSSITVDGSHNTFTVGVNGNNYTVKLNNGVYSQADFISELNRQLAAKSIGVTASLLGSNLVLATTEAQGTNSKLAFDTKNCGTIGTAMFGDLVTNTPAKATLNTPLQSSIQIEDGANEFKVRIIENSIAKDYSVQIPAGTYTPAELTAKLDELYGDDITVGRNGNYLTFTSKATGSNVSIQANNSIGGSAATAMFGENTYTSPDVTASVENGKLVLTGSNVGGSYTLSVTPSPDSVFLKPVATTKTVTPVTHTGSVTISYYTLTSSNSLSGGVDIEDYNRDLSFTFHSPAGDKDISLTLDANTHYNAAQLRDALQKKLNEALGDDNTLKVNLTANNGLQIQSVYPGSEYSLANLEGGFYEYVLKGTAERQATLTPSNISGKQILTDTYIIGRKDVRHSPVTIREGLTDELSIDVTINDHVYTLQMTLDPGTYNTNDLLRQLQQKIDEQVAAKGLPEHMVQVAVGKFNSGVIGADDANALDIYINPDIHLEAGNYKIDGLTGSSLFEIFYKTTGEPVPAYITGTKDISQGTTIDSENNELSLDVDGVTYTYTIPEGTYTSDALIQTLTDLFNAPDKNGKTALIEPSISGNALKISYKKIGKHEISNIQGSAKPDLFYTSTGRKDYDSTLYLQVGANSEQLLDIKRFSVSTISLGINSLTVSKTKYAQKALERIDQAFDYFNTCRSWYGASQNRLEHVIQGNNTTAENLQASESRDRDADLAEEMVANAKQRILQQSGMAMLAQAKKSAGSVLSLLQS